MNEGNHWLAFGVAVMSAIDVSQFPPGLSQKVIVAGNQGKLKRRLTQFFLNQGWLPPCPSPLIIDRSIQVHELGPRWPVWLGPVDGNGLEGKPDIDLRAGTILAFDASKVRLLDGLNEGQPTITGEEKRRKLRVGIHIQIDVQTLWALYAENGQVTLRWLHDHHEVTWMESLGTILRNPNGRRCSFCLYRWGSGAWGWDCNWVDSRRDASNPALGLAIA